MATLHVRNVPDDLYQKISGLAADRQRSIGAEVVMLLGDALRSQAVREERAQALNRIARRRGRLGNRFCASDSVELIREDRER